MFYQIIFHGYEDEHTCNIFEGTDVEKVFKNAYDEYTRILNHENLSDNEVSDYTPAQSFAEFCVCKPDFIPIECLSWIHIHYRIVDTNTKYRWYTEED